MSSSVYPVVYKRIRKVVQYPVLLGKGSVKISCTGVIFSIYLCQKMELIQRKIKNLLDCSQKHIKFKEIHKWW